MKNITREQFFIFITDILNFLSRYIDITNVAKNYENAKYILTDNEKNKIKIDSNISVDIEVKKDSGLTTVPIVLRTLGFELVNPTCYVRKMENIDEMKETMFHELMHVGSIYQRILSKEKILYSTGLYNKIYNKTKNGLAGPEHYLYLNEAMTELTAKFIYDRLYEDKYSIVRLKKNCYKNSIYEKGYFVLAFMLLNYFEDNPKDLFEIYFNNNIKLLDKILRKECKMTLRSLNKKIVKFQENYNNTDIEIEIEYRKMINQLYKENPLRNENVICQYLK